MSAALTRTARAGIRGPRVRGSIPRTFANLAGCPHDITKHRVSLVTSTPIMPSIADVDELDRQLADLFEGDDPAEIYAEIVKAFERMRVEQSAG